MVLLFFSFFPFTLSQNSLQVPRALVPQSIFNWSAPVRKPAGPLSLSSPVFVLIPWRSLMPPPPFHYKFSPSTCERFSLSPIPPLCRFFVSPYVHRSGKNPPPLFLLLSFFSAPQKTRTPGLSSPPLVVTQHRQLTFNSISD